jgi:protein SDA1
MAAADNSNSGVDVNPLRTTLSIAMDIQRLPELQSTIKKSPDLYAADVAQAYTLFHTHLELFTQEPSGRHEVLGALATFLAQVSPYFVIQLRQFPSELLNILDNYYSALNPELRKAVFSALVLMRSREQITPMSVLPTAFRMFRCADKPLRSQAFAFIVSDIKRVNTPNIQSRLNHKLLTFISSMLSDSNVNAAKKSLHVLMTIYKRCILRDVTIVNTIALACMSPEAKVATSGACFMIAADDNTFESDSESEEEKPNPNIVGKKKTKGTLHKKDRQVNAFEKRQRRKEHDKSTKSPTFLCIDMIHNPQDFAEGVFSNVLKHFNKGKFKARITLLHLVARMIGRHKLFLMDLYTYLMKYIKPKTNYAGQILVIVSESVHDLVPPDDLAPLFKKILHEFISDNCTEETITMGLNTAREMCKRQPLIMTKDIMQDLSGFRAFRNRAVVMAAKSLINLYKDLNPTVLQGKDRGSLKGFQPLEYAEQRPAIRVPGAELLEQSDEIHKNYSRQTVFCRQQMAVSDNFLKLMKHKEKLKDLESQEPVLHEGAADEEIIDEEVSDEFEEEGSSEEDEEEENSDLSEEEEQGSEEAPMLVQDNAEEAVNEPTNDEIAPPNPFLPQAPLPFECDHILSQQDFRKIHTLQRMVEAKKRRAEIPADALESDSDDEGPHHFVEDEDIQTFRRPKNERIEEKRLEKQRFKQREKGGAPTQQEHDKHKPTMMLLPKLRKDMKSELGTVRKQLRNVKKQFKGHFSKRFKQNY